jgi:hypothetical protein
MNVLKACQSTGFFLCRKLGTLYTSIIREYSIMAKICSREAALLILPLIILVPVVFRNLGSPSLQNATVTPQSGYVAQVKSVNVEPATAREVYGGYDTRVTIIYKYPRLPGTTWWSKPQDPSDMTVLGGGALRLTAQTNGHESMLKDPKRFSTVTKLSQAGGELVCILRLRDIPAAAKQLTLHAQILGVSSRVKNAAGKVGFLTTLPVNVAVVVRRAGERIELPAVSKEQPLRLKAVSVGKPKSPSNPGDDTVVTLAIGTTDPSFAEAEFRSKCGFYNWRLVDASGKEYKETWRHGAKMAEILTRSSYDKEEGKHTFTFTFPLKSIPASAGRVTFKTEVSYNDGWPLPVEVVVRKS